MLSPVLVTVILFLAVPSHLRHGTRLSGFGRRQGLRAGLGEKQLEHEMIIPHIVHQSYKNKDISSWKLTWVLALNSWTLLNPRWIRKFWLDEDNRSLISTKLPKYLKKYDRSVCEVISFKHVYFTFKHNHVISTHVHILHVHIT
jgi:hypothetical protein